MNNKNIPIFFACDDNYIPYLSVALKSIIFNASKNYDYSIKILHTNINELNQSVIKSFENENFNIEFVNVLDCIHKINDKLYTRDYYSKTTYYRLFIPNLYPNIDKCLYLDGDIVVKGDISKLYNYDIKNNLLGGISDEIVNNCFEFTEYVEKRLGIKSENYINAGIIVMNLKAMREFDFENKFIELLNKIKFTVAQDQDYINTICKNRIFYVPKTWNKQPILDSTTKEEDINLIHYNLNLKPWHYNGILYENIFWEYAKTSPYYNFIKNTLESFPQENIEKDKIDNENLKKLAYNEALNLGVIDYYG